MSISNTISFLLGFKEQNLAIDEIFENETIEAKGHVAKHIHLKTTTDFILCPHCGRLTGRLHDYRTVKVHHSVCGRFPLIVSIRKKRFECSCGRIVTEALDAVDKNCFISNETKRSLIASLRQTGSLLSIAQAHNVSYSTVYRALEKVGFHSAPAALPDVLSFDEFKADTDEGKYAFVALDPINRKIVEILGDRRYDTVYRFFLKYSKAQRLKVRFIVSDLWKPYLKIARMLFPNAVFVADKFHYQRLASNAFNAVRKEASARLDEKDARQIRKYWKLLNRKESRLDYKERKYSRWLKRPVSQVELINALLALDPRLKEAYGLYQEFLTLIGLDSPDDQVRLFEKWLQKAFQSSCTEMQQAAHSLRRWQDGVKASFVPYNGHYLSNGIIEGFNNRIKVIKRVSYGYRSFINFKKRILLSFL